MLSRPIQTSGMNRTLALTVYKCCRTAGAGSDAEPNAARQKTITVATHSPRDRVEPSILVSSPRRVARLRAEKKGHLFQSTPDGLRLRMCDVPRSGLHLLELSSRSRSVEPSGLALAVAPDGFIRSKRQAKRRGRIRAYNELEKAARHRDIIEIVLGRENYSALNRVVTSLRFPRESLAPLRQA